jgi:hypothetical protein
MTISTPSFPEAMQISGDLVALWESGELSDEVMADRVGVLVASRDGARGFFVVALAGDSPLMDRLPEPLVATLRLGGEEVVDLTARNLAMSTAMVVQHRRNGDADQQAGSERVQARCTELLRQLEPSQVKRRLERMLTATAGLGEDVTFLQRWGYDSEQLQAIGVAIHAVAE